MNRYSVSLGNNLRARLFIRNDAVYMAGKGPVTYDIRLEHEALAVQTWAVHGVCLKCGHQSIMDGRCAECALDYRDSAHGHPRSHLVESAIQKQINLAHEIVNVVEYVMKS